MSSFWVGNSDASAWRTSDSDVSVPSIRDPRASDRLAGEGRPEEQLGILDQVSEALEVAKSAVSF
jgi:hypothetical protein